MEIERYNRLLHLIDQAYWTRSKTYKAPFDHEYILRHQYPELCVLLQQAIAEDGYVKPFMGHPYRYLDLDGYRYWHYQVVFNRDLANKEFGG